MKVAQMQVEVVLRMGGVEASAGTFDVGVDVDLEDAQPGTDLEVEVALRPEQISGGLRSLAEAIDAHCAAGAREGAE
ncbi:hypothetical protein [Nocardiopsis synnemataformans]|uniref:hypothetical protein n=1 Tax=Nocardiopsis synnemataformans TaxID=61305 RepID=UPI003EBDFBE5